MADYVKLLKSLDWEIGQEEAKLAKIKNSPSDQTWGEKRLGLTKRLYDLKEKRQVFYLRSKYPGLTFYGQARYVGYELQLGKVVPITTVRIPDVIQEHGKQVQPHELKTDNYIEKSVSGGKSVQYSANFNFSTYLTYQLRKEEAIIEAAKAQRAKIIIVCDDYVDLVTTKKKTIKVDPEDLNISRVMTYKSHPDLVLGAPGSPANKPPSNTSGRRGPKGGGDSGGGSSSSTPMMSGASASTSNANKQKTTPKSSTRTPQPRKPTVGDRATSASSRFINSVHRGVSRSLRNATSKTVSYLGKFNSNEGSLLIKNLPPITKGLNSIQSTFDTLDTYLEALKTALSSLSSRSPIPEFDAELEKILKPLNDANRKVTKIYEYNITFEDHRPIQEALYNIGDTESLDEILEILMQEDKYLLNMQTELPAYSTYLTELQADLIKTAAWLNFAMAMPAYETASKGTATLMFAAINDRWKGLSGPINDTQGSIDALEAIRRDYSELFNAYNDVSKAIHIHRHFDLDGRDTPSDLAKPKESLWGPDVLSD